MRDERLEEGKAKLTLAATENKQFEISGLGRFQGAPTELSGYF